MKRMVLSLAILATVSMGMSANNMKDKDKDHRRGGKSPMKELNLTAEQQEQMKTLRESYQVKQKDLSASYRSDVEKILTPEQQAKWQEMNKDRASHNRFSDHKGKKGKRGGHCDRKMDAETTAKLDTLKDNYTKERKAVEMSRIAPDLQKERIEKLTDKYRTDRKQIMMEARQSKADEKSVL